MSIRWFQYQVLHRIIPTNNYLYTIKAASSNLCTFCLIFTESIQHLFFHCTFSQRIWGYFQNVFKRAGIQIDLKDISVVLFGNDYASEVNLILILLKKYIFNCKKMKTFPTVNGSLSFLEEYIILQKYIAQKNLREGTWEKCWLPWLNLFHF